MNSIYKKIAWTALSVILLIILSIMFAYIRLKLGADTTSTANINQKVQANYIWLLVPLLFAPIAEEWLIRKTLVRMLSEKLSWLVAMIIANLFFAFLHLDLFFLPYFINGCIYSMCYKKTGKLIYPIISHILYNFFVLFISTII